ncbi:MAG TPA: OB-fold nucleic acid binding domain-containing protein [Candidatus Dormibacteraeota bacterium]|nr:OB-fold nucleic acid binding domain-containing protein [Candidatus Dormibacteraeota bacterium]
MGQTQWRQLFDICQRLQGFPRHLSIHVGGMLVTGRPLIDMLPVERATMPGRVVIQFNKDDAEDLGLIKMDMLGLRTLSVVDECLDLVEAASGERPDLDALPLDDPEVYRIASAADTVGVFQIESRAQMATLPRTRPQVFEDLVLEVAIIRPGPIQGNAVNPYIRRRQGREPVTYPHPKLEPILEDTLGVILFQEQILEITMQLGGYTASQSDAFRRAMNRHRSVAEMESLRAGFLTAVARHSGVEEELGNQIFDSVAGFAQYGFCRCLAGDTPITDALTGRIATLAEMAEAAVPAGPAAAGNRPTAGGVLAAPPVTTVWSLGPDRRLHPAPVTALYRNGVRPVFRVATRGGREITVTGNHPLLTPQGWRQVDDLGPGCEVAMRWSGGDIYWERLAAVDPAGESETFDLTVEPRHNFVAGGFVVHNSHAAAFARTTYETVWLRRHFPAPYYCGLLNNQPMGFYHPSVLVEDAKRHGVEVLPVDVNLSRERCLPDGPGALRLGFNQVRGLGPGAVERIRRERRRGEFRDLQDFCDRVCVALTEAELAERERPAYGRVGTSLHPPAPSAVERAGVDNLVVVGAFDAWGFPRRDLLWQVREAFGDAGGSRVVGPAPVPAGLPEMTEAEVTATDYRVLGLTSGRHLVSYYRERLYREGVLSSARLREMPDGRRVQVGGLVITRQAPGTARRFRFFTLEDEWGHVNLILRPDFFDRHRALLTANDLLVFSGTVQAQDGVLSIRATGVRALPPPEAKPQPRNFR